MRAEAGLCDRLARAGMWRSLRNRRYALQLSARLALRSAGRPHCLLARPARCPAIRHGLGLLPRCSVGERLNGLWIGYRRWLTRVAYKERCTAKLTSVSNDHSSRIRRQRNKVGLTRKRRASGLCWPPGGRSGRQKCDLAARSARPSRFGLCWPIKKSVALLWGPLRR